MRPSCCLVPRQGISVGKKFIDIGDQIAEGQSVGDVSLTRKCADQYPRHSQRFELGSGERTFHHQHEGTCQIIQFFS